MTLEDEVDHESLSEHDSASEEYMNDNDVDQSSQLSMSTEFYVGRNKTFKWSFQAPSQSRTRQHNIVTGKPGPLGKAWNKDMSIIESFQCMFDESMFELIALHTNEYISYTREKFARDRDARSTSVNEIEAYVGVLILIGIQKSNHTNVLDIWSDDGFGSD